MKISYKTQQKISGKIALTNFNDWRIVQPFQSHFHEHYVIGFVEKDGKEREYGA